MVERASPKGKKVSLPWFVAEMQNLKSWWAAQKAAGLEQTRQHSNFVVITGPGRTADIAMQLVMGMHGPRQLHLILLEK